MNLTNNKNKAKHYLLLLLACTVLLTSCLEEEDPFVDRVASPVLMVFEGVTGYLASGGLTSVPSRSLTVTSATYATPVTLSVRIFELDKSGILDNTIGIDSIPVVGLAIKFTKRDGTVLDNLTTESNGRITTTKTWAELGVPTFASAASTVTIPLSWTGSYNGQSFTRYSQVQFVKSGN
jgi:hypothetical protein